MKHLYTLLTIGVLLGGVYLGQLWAHEPGGTSKTGLYIHDFGTVCVYANNTVGGMWGITKAELQIAPGDLCPGRSK